MSAMSRSCLTACMALHFPEVVKYLVEEDIGILHLEVGAMKLATRRAIDNQQWDIVRSHFAFMDNLLANAEVELREAIHVSYLGNLFYGEMSFNHARARCMLPKPLAAALEHVERHYDELAV
jgi:hypothetical protein